MMTIAMKAMAMMAMMPTAMSAATVVAAMAMHDYGGDGDDHMLAVATMRAWRRRW